MRWTSQRRSTIARGVKYRGAPGVAGRNPLNLLGAIAAGADDPGEVCENCKTKIKLTPKGRMRSHALKGWKVNVKEGMYPCPPNPSEEQ